MTDDFLRIVPHNEPFGLRDQGAPSKAARLAASIADLLDVLAEECGGRLDFQEWAGALRNEFGGSAPALRSSTVKIDFSENIPEG